MAKKSWCSLLKRFFISETRLNREKKIRRRWMLGRLKVQRLGLASASVSSPSRERASETEEEQSKNAISVAIATAAAADAAVAVVEIAAEVLSGTAQSTNRCEEEAEEFSNNSNEEYNAPPSTPQYEREIQEIAATKIQTVFRGYLARKALRALKGLVRLQAIIRGRAVRRQAITTLKRLQSIVNIQSRVRAKRILMVDGTSSYEGSKELQEFRGKDIKIDSSSQRRWDDSLLTKEEENALCSSKRMAAIKRERIKEYSFSHRSSSESENSKVNGSWRNWLEQWVDAQLAKRETLQNPETISSSNVRSRDEFGGRQLKLRSLQKQQQNDGLDPLINVPRRSFHHRKQRSIGDDNAGGGSPVVPTYMAATESAKAKVRSMSSPRLRPTNFDAQSETNSPYKHKLSPISSINSEVTSSSMISNLGFSQRSPCLKGIPGPLKSGRSSKGFSIDSGCSVPKWGRHGTLR